MIKIIMGLKGMGKTKSLIENVNNDAKNNQGNIVCIEKGTKLRYDISHTVRLISAEEYGINSYEKFYGLICGLVAGNYDINKIYIDSILKICNSNDINEFEKFLNILTTSNINTEIIMTASYDETTVSENIKKYF